MTTHIHIYILVIALVLLHISPCVFTIGLVIVHLWVTTFSHCHGQVPDGCASKDNITIEVRMLHV
jgi:hypothetical protein